MDSAFYLDGGIRAGRGRPKAADTRTVISSVVVAEGAFKGVGRFVEVVPGDPVSQDDLVSRGGTVHAVSTLGTLLPGFLSTCIAACSAGRSSSACK